MPSGTSPRSSPDSGGNGWSRPRLKNTRAEALLRSVENGSVTHLAQMATIERYPSDPHDGAIVLRSVLRLLDTAPTPTRLKSFDSPSAVPTKQALQRIFGWMDIMGISIRKVDRSDEAMATTFSEIYIQNLHVILRWLKFYMRDASWAFTWEIPAGEWLATKIVAETLNNLNTVISSASLSSNFRQSAEVVDLLLAVWMWQDKNGKAMYLSYPPDKSEGRFAICPTIQLFTQFCIDPDSQFLVWEKISALKRRDHDRLMQGALSRMEQWRPPPREQLLSFSPINGLDTLILSVCTLLDIQGVAKAFVRLNIAGNALRLARAHGDIASIGASSMSFAAKLGSSMLHTKSTSVMGDLQHRIIAQLLNEGLLEILLDEMFGRHSLNPKAYPFQVTDHDRETNAQTNPFLYLASFCMHRAVCDAARNAVSAIPEPRMSVLQRGWAAQYWRPFGDALRLYEAIWARIPTQRVVLCDNFKHVHDATATTTLNTKAKECSRCRVAVYCSEGCQKEDWDAWHKEECRINRIDRLDLELRSAWESHTSRAFFLLLLQQLVLNYTIGLPLHSHSGTMSQDGWTLLRDFSTESQPGDSAPSIKRPIEFPLIHFHTTEMPFKAVVESLGSQGTPSDDGDSPQTDNQPPLAFPPAPRARFAALLAEAFHRLNTMQKRGPEVAERSKFSTLAMSTVPLGQFEVMVFGRFIVEGNDAGVQVTLSNGYLRITPGDHFVDLY